MDDSLYGQQWIPNEGAAEEGLFFFFRTCTQERIRNKGPRRDLFKGPEAIQEARCDATRLAKTTWLLFHSVHMNRCVCNRERELAYQCLQCLSQIHVESFLVLVQSGCQKRVSHRPCPPSLATRKDIDRSSK